MTQQGTLPTSSAWSERLIAIAKTVVGTWDHAASFTQAPNMSAHDRAGMAMQIWLTMLGLEQDQTERGIALARKVVREGTSSL